MESPTELFIKKFFFRFDAMVISSAYEPTSQQKNPQNMHFTILAYPPK